MKLDLEAGEWETLFQMSVNHPWRDARLRATGLLMLSKGEHPKAVAAQCGVTFQTVYNWHRAWIEKGLKGLMGGHAGARPPKLTAAWIETSLKIARAEALTLKEIAHRAEAIHGHVFPCSLFRLRAALLENGFSFKRTRWSLKKSETKPISRPVSANWKD